MDMYDDNDETLLTCFDPAFEIGYPVLMLRWLEGEARLCPEFQPTVLSHLAPDWLREAREDQDDDRGD